MASRDTQTIMTEEHKGLLIRHLPEFVKNLDLTATFWAFLLRFCVLTSSEKQRIEGSGSSDEDKALDLMQLLMKKSDEAFYHLIVALRRTGQTHLVTLLVSPEDNQAVVLSQHAKGGEAGPTDPSLQEVQLVIQKSLMRTCSSVETWTWSADKNYVPIGEIFTDLVWVQSRQHPTGSDGYETLGNYLDMFQIKGNQPASFVFLQGLAGSGKSTLIQMLVVKWCRMVHRRWLGESVNLSDKEIIIFSKFKYVLLIFLRHVKKGQKIINIMQQQYCIESKTAELLYSKMSEFQRETLIFLEGYDEFIESTSSEITDIAHRRAFTEATVMITSRHSPSYHFPDVNDRASMPDNHVLLRGFGSAGVTQYINNFFHEIDKAKVAPLLDNIKQSDELTDLSRFPAILLLICTLWAHEGSLSDSITGFFLKFVAYVCGRYESKFVKTKQRSISKNIIEKYHVCLMKIGEVSVGGLREEKLQLSFLFKDVMDKIGETAWQLGFLKRENNMEGEELVVFPHKTMQEFFTAYYVVNCDKVKQKELLVKFCSSIQAVKESEMIQTFISGLGGEEIKKEIDKIIHGSESETAEIIPALQLSYLAENRNAQLKLPARVVLEVTDRYREEVYKLYLDNDCTAVTHLTVEAWDHQSVTDRAVLPSVCNMSRLTELRFGDYSLSVFGLGTLSHILTTGNIQLTTLNLWNAVGRDVAGAPWPSLMASLPLSLMTFDVSWNDITDESTRQLSRRVSHLKQLHVIKMSWCNLSDAGAVLEIIKNCQTLTEFSVSVNNLGDELEEIVNLTPNMAGLRELRLNNNNLSDHVRDRIRRQLSKDLPQLYLDV